MLRAPSRSLLGATIGVLAALVIAACSSDSDTVEVQRKLSLRLEHRPPGRVPAGEDVELGARVQSSLEGPRLEAWVRVLAAEPDGADTKIDFELTPEGEGTATIEARKRGESLHYVIEARDAAGLVVALPKNADEGGSYTLSFEGSSSRILGGISFFSALIAAILYVGAGAAAAQNLRAQMSAGPAGLLGGVGLVLGVGGLFLIGSVHAYQVTGGLWPSGPIFLSLSRGDLAIASLLWAGNLVFGRKVLLDDEPDGASRGERGFAVTGIAIAVLTVLIAIF